MIWALYIIMVFDNEPQTIVVPMASEAHCEAARQTMRTAGYSTSICGALPLQRRGVAL